MNQHEIIAELTKYLPVVLLKGRGEIYELQILFNIYNDNRLEIAGDANVQRETAVHCSGCVQRVITRLKAYYDKHKVW